MNTHAYSAKPAAQQRSVFVPAPGLLLQRKCACGGTPGPSGDCQECRKKQVARQQREFLGMQTKLAIGASNDPLEQEADRVADQVLAAPAHLGLRGSSPRIQRFSGQSNEKMAAAPASVDYALASSGRPLEPALRRDMEQRFGHDFSRVRVHSGMVAEKSARDVNAHAYTVGHDIVFGAGGFAPGTPDGRRLIAHELAHIVQQMGSDGICVGQGTEKSGPAKNPSPAGYQLAGSGFVGVLQRQPAGGAGIPATTGRPKVATWEKRWWAFTVSKSSGGRANTMEIAKELVFSLPDFGDLMNRGLAVVEWLQDNGEHTLAAQMLDKIRGSYTTAWATESRMPGIGWSADISVTGPFGTFRTLLRLAEDAAHGGKHDEAFKFLGGAYEILSYQAHQTTELRRSEDLSRVEAYFGLERIYDGMRQIHAFYYVLEREALIAGDAKTAALMRTKAAELAQQLKQEYSLGNVQTGLVEGSAVKTAKGPALRLEGANSVTTDLTELPGLTSPKELGEEIQLEGLDATQSGLMAQAELQAEIAREPEVRKAFGGTPIDLSDTKQRQKVWRIMYGAYKKAGLGALGSLMALIGKYLKAFTKHTTYNVRDFGPNYLDSKFPTNLASQVAMDCGVYALTVAWDVHQTVKSSDPGMQVDFRLVAFLDHVSLVIDDKSTGESYIVNNDNITRINQVPPQLRPFFQPIPSMDDGADEQQYVGDWIDPTEKAEREYAAMRGLSHLVTPSYTYHLGSTTNTARRFHDQVWTRYLRAAEEMAVKQSAATRTPKGGSAFGLQKLYSENLKAVDALVDKLSGSPLANDPQEIAAQLQTIMVLAIPAMVVFERMARTFAPLNEQRRLILKDPGASHSLVRVALVILRLQNLGGIPTADQQTYFKFIASWFSEEIDQRRQEAEAGKF